MTWVLIAWSALILVWVIAGANAADCGSQSDQVSQDACNTGAGIGVLLVLFVGFIGFMFFSLIWFMTRPKGRDCPRCGEHVKRGQTSCKTCGYDYAAALEGPADRIETTTG